MPKSAKDVTISNQTLKTMVIGDFGSGKSAFANTCPTKGYVFDFDKGILIYRGGDWDYEQFETSGKGWLHFEKEFREVTKAITEKKYKTVIVDSTTTMTDMAMERAMQLDPKRSPTGGPLWNVHYQIVKNLMEPKIRQLMQLNCNIVLISHQAVTQDQETGAILSIDPMLTGQLSQKVPGYFDEVYYAFTRTVQGKTKYFLRTVTKGLYKARSRISGVQRIMPDEIPNDYNEVLKYIKKENKKETKT